MLTISNALGQYHAQIQQAGRLCAADVESRGGETTFVPEFSLPDLDERLQRFFSLSTIRVRELAEYKGSRIRLLDLTCNPRTRTTKTFASHVMVARAVRHIQATGESILLVTPTSGNKGGALRDAVLHAIECGLVQPHQLRIAIVVPRQGIAKLWNSPLSAEPELRRLNPVFVVHSGSGSEVKRLTRTFAQEHSAQLWREQGVRVWHTYQLENYLMADAVRAFVEADSLGAPAPGANRVHAQAVSSAFGLLGYDHGRRVLSQGGTLPPAVEWLLVQHMGTPDLVLNALYGSCSRDNLPDYRFDAASGLHVQSAAAAFPARTLATDEIIDSTFYSNNPITADRVKAAQDSHGGAGIVVSLQECLERYGFIRAQLGGDGPSLPADPREVREWALVMVLTGVYTAIDRGLLAAGSEFVVHASGCYSSADYVPLPADAPRPATEVDDLLQVILDGAPRPSPLSPQAVLC